MKTTKHVEIITLKLTDCLLFPGVILISEVQISNRGKGGAPGWILVKGGGTVPRWTSRGRAGKVIKLGHSGVPVFNWILKAAKLKHHND